MSVGRWSARFYQEKMREEWMLTISIIEFDLNGLILAHVDVILADLWLSRRDSIHGVQIEFLASTIGCQLDRSCQACVTFRSPGCH